jgi:hypothetical protein
MTDPSVQSANVVELGSARAFDCSARTADSAPPPERAALRLRFGGGRQGKESETMSPFGAVGNRVHREPLLAFFPLAGGGTFFCSNLICQ